MYYYIFLWLIIIFLIITLFKLVNLKKNYIICFFLSIAIITFFLNLKIAIASAIDGCKLWFNAILPTVLPFSVICNLLIAYDGITLYSKFLGPLICKPLGLSKSCSFPLIASILCGYPLGAKYSSDIYNLGYIDRREYERLINIATNCGPLFILGPVATALFNNIRIGILLLIANYISPFIIGLFLRRKSNYSKPEISNFSFQEKDFGENLKDALSKAINTTLSIGGFIIIFSVIIGVISSNKDFTLLISSIERFFCLPTNCLYGLLLGSIEITKGCNILATSNLNLVLKISITSFLCSFSGICIVAQASSFISKDKISISKYTVIKFAQGMISFIITFILCSIFIGTIETSNISHINVFTNNLLLCILPFIIIIVVSSILYIIKKLFFHIS